MLSCLHIGLGDAAAAAACAAVVLGLRLAAIRYQLSLPMYKSR